ncbi:unnamed protein product [Absidia cylindrospora]
MFRFRNQNQQRLLIPDATCSEQSDIKDKLTNLDIADHDQVENEIIYTSLELDSTDTNYNNFELDFADKNHLKHYAHEIIDYTATEIQIKHNGTVFLTPHFRQFPSELVSLIVRYCLEQQNLCALSLVSKQFYVIANPLLWHAPKIPDDTAVDKFLNSVAKCRSLTTTGFIRKMEFSSNHWNNICFSLLIPHLCHLEELTICSSVSIDNTSFRHLPRHCPNLKSLQLNFRCISSTTFAELGKHCYQLRQVTLISTTYISSSH